MPVCFQLLARTLETAVAICNAQVCGPISLSMYIHLKRYVMKTWR